ncbi:MAG: diguanylate cyclase [Acidobacteria bacterium]|nr:diguanylate cyclase [Acidobacteriota bacterium]NIM61370.1 diguanylate cyclase [Acidobacteriota bacterium]NIO58805.1 diguanylate cyclase [Acidobacteriota bacterium]NIQ29849.1 diguanylate cyclase [Acidobacteriota bacterium]NIQ84582.1 diguanylate cyclase [Acidobacteriota bacterium]
MAQTTRVGREANRRILVVDDVATNLRLVEGHLRREGYQVQLAGSGEGALRAIEAQEPDLVLLDVIMPGVDGFETCRRIRANPATRHIPVILLTSLTDLDHKAQGQRAGADDFVTKPFDRNELLIRVRSMLRIKALHDRLKQKIAELESAKIRLRRLADTDPLTSLYNKRYLTEGLRIEVARAERYHNELSLIMIDVDHFKAINDRFGHQTGDVVLQQMATLFVNGVRSIDIAHRYGGEEFAIVLPETPFAGAVFVAERLGEQVRRHRFLDVDGEPLAPITISIGVASRGAEAADAETLIKLADARLYDAKQRGRNCVVAESNVLAESVSG